MAVWKKIKYRNRRDVSQRAGGGWSNHGRLEVENILNII